jgi:hypothetical protein
MSTATKTIKVRPLDTEIGVFQVQSSETPQKPHTVDLLAHGGQGSCTCQDWSARCRPNQKKAPMKFIPYGSAGRPNPERQECKHVFVARRYFLREVLQGLARQHRGGSGT